MPGPKTDINKKGLKLPVVVIIVGGSSSRLLSEHLAAEAGWELASVELKRFPDGESYVRVISPLEDKDVLIVSATFPDGNIIETLLLHDAVVRRKPASVKLLVPYYGYQRQDKLFKEGESVSAEVIAGVLDNRFDEIMTVDLHAEGVSKYIRNTKTRNFVASTQLARHFRNSGIDIVISPDGGLRAVEYAKLAAEELGIEYDYFLKERIDSTNVKLYPKKLDVKGKNVLIVDDIIATGGSMVAAMKRLKELGAKKIFAGCTHGLFTGNSLPRLKELAEEVISTDTIESDASRVSVAPLVSEHLFEVKR